MKTIVEFNSSFLAKAAAVLFGLALLVFLFNRYDTQKKDAVLDSKINQIQESKILDTLRLLIEKDTFTSERLEEIQFYVTSLFPSKDYRNYTHTHIVLLQNDRFWEIESIRDKDRNDIYHLTKKNYNADHIERIKALIRSNKSYAVDEITDYSKGILVPVVREGPTKAVLRIKYRESS